jgi:hypothetical protein
MPLKFGRISADFAEFGVRDFTDKLCFSGDRGPSRSQAQAIKFAPPIDHFLHGTSPPCDDALEFPDGEIVLLTRLYEGQKATVLTLPTQPKTAAEAEAQQRVAYVG